LIKIYQKLEFIIAGSGEEDYIGELKAKQEFTFKEALIIFGTIGGIIFVLIKYPQIAPNFSVIANEVLIATKSMVGLG